MFFYPITLSLQKFIKEDILVLPESSPINEWFLVSKAWKHLDLLCKNYVLSRLEDDHVQTSKELWDVVKKKYKMEDARLNKFVETKFLDYKVIDSKSVIIQVQELQVIIHDLLAEDLVINEAFQVVDMIEKLSPS